MKLLVTGGSGFIGSNFVRYWLANHPQDLVVNFDLLTYAGNLQNLSDVAEKSADRYKFVKGDICDISSVESAFAEGKESRHFVIFDINFFG